MKYSVKFILAIISVLIVFSCNNQSTKPDDSEAVNFKVKMASANMPASVAGMQAELTREGFDTLSAAFTIGEYYANADFGDVIAGEWQLSVSAFDEYNTLIYYGETAINILAGQDNIVNLHLDPVTGTLLVNVTWGPDLTDGLVAYYPFNGNTNDESGNGLHGIPQDVELTSDRFGNPGSAYLFFGGYSAIDCGDILNDLEIPFTVSAWINPSTNQSQFAIFHSDRHENFYESYPYYGIGFFLSMTAGDGVTPLDSFQLQIKYCDGEGSGSNDRRTKAGTTLFPDDGQWKHVVAIVRGEQDMSLYINAIDDGGTYHGTGGPMVHNEWNAYIGAKFQGTIDEVRIYDRELTVQEISTLYSATQ